MATTAWRNKAAQTPKYKTRAYHRCQICGRSRGTYRKFRL
ncbi:MAG TPA: uS14 family ribosomal protein, partial [Planctomycetota bacterium]|nr:uS14 family ribosomal protein [Planctomycetota bacterium]